MLLIKYSIGTICTHKQIVGTGRFGTQSGTVFGNAVGKIITMHHNISLYVAPLCM